MPQAGGTKRRRIPRRNTLAARIAAREGISLRGVGISEKTESRYRSAMALVIPFLEQAEDMQDLDPICEEWVEHNWETGTPLGIIGDALCGLHYFWPQVKGHLRGSWKLYRNWRKIEIPQRAPPLPRHVCVGLIGFWLQQEEVTMAFLVALGFHAYLRTGEILKLTRCDITMSSNKGVVVIKRSKTGLRFNMDESVALYDTQLPRLWELVILQRDLENSERIWPRSGSAFRDQFHAALRALDLESLGFSPLLYQKRRGNTQLYDFACAG